eukprot:15015760-Alexandrium_andersonii.AAC.1
MWPLRGVQPSLQSGDRAMGRRHSLLRMQSSGPQLQNAGGLPDARSGELLGRRQLRARYLADARRSSMRVSFTWVLRDWLCPSLGSTWRGAVWGGVARAANFGGMLQVWRCPPRRAATSNDCRGRTCARAG